MRAVVLLILVIASAGRAATAQDFDNTRICEAIAKELSVRLFYRPGEPERIVEPQFLYYTKNRDVILNGRQVAGYSKSGKLPGSRSFRLDRAQKIEFIDRPTSSVPGGRELPSGSVEVICRR